MDCEASFYFFTKSQKGLAECEHCGALVKPFDGAEKHAIYHANLGKELDRLSGIKDWVVAREPWDIRFFTVVVEHDGRAHHTGWRELGYG